MRSRSKMVQANGQKCRKCGNPLYVTVLEGRLFCKKCYEYKANGNEK